MRQIVKDNRGMTLIELIIAITILGVVATPLLHGFLTSAQTEAKARRIGEVTSVAQNVMEVVEGNSFDDLLVKQIDSDYDIFETLLINDKNDPYDDGGVGYYTLPGEDYIIGSENGTKRVNTDKGDYHLGLTNILSGSKRYNAMIDIDPVAYNQYNSDDGLSVNYEENIFFPVPKIALENITSTGERLINVNISRSDDKTKLNVEVKYESTILELKDHDISNGLPALYILYHPSYKYENDKAVVMQDRIIISNMENLEIDLFIVKQKDEELAKEPVYLEQCELLSKCYVEQQLTDYDPANHNTGAILYTNVADNLVRGGTLSNDDLIYKIVYGENLEHVVQGTTFKDDTSIIKTKEEPSKRIYKVTVKIFEKDKGFTGEPLGTLTGSILR